MASIRRATLVAVATALAAGVLTADPAAAATTPSPFTLCAWPQNCSAASVRGMVNWSANTVEATVTNTAYPTVTATFRTTDSTLAVVPRGTVRSVLRTFSAADTAVTVTLCVPPTLMPNPCVSTTLIRS